jgi:hypothetical protein
MSKARDLADSVSTGGILEDGAVSVSEVSGAAPTASPTFTDDIIIDSSSNTPVLRFDESSAAKFFIGESSTVGGGAGYDLYAGTGDGISLFTNASEAMRIDSSGNVGIGTSTAPSGSSATSRFITVAGSGDGVLQLTKNGSGGGAIASASGTGMLFYTHTGTVGSETYSERFRIGSSGQLGIGGATYGTSGQVLTSGGSGAAPSWADAAGGGTAEFTATGTIATGDIVALRSDGTVEVVAQSNSSTPTVDNSTLITTNFPSRMAAVYNSTDNVVMVAYTDQSNSSYVYGTIGTISGDTITFSTPVQVIGATSMVNAMVYDSSQDRAVFFVKRTATDDEVYIYTAYNNNGSFATESFVGNIQNNSNESSYAACFDSNVNKTVFAIETGGPSTTAFVITITANTSIDICGQGSVCTVANGDQITTQNAEDLELVFDSTNNKVVAMWNNGANNNLYASVGTVNTGSFPNTTWGSLNNFSSSRWEVPSAAFDTNAGKFLVVYRDAGTSPVYGKARVGTVSGTTVSFGTEVIIATEALNFLQASYDSDTNRLLVTYRKDSNTNGAAKIATISGTSVSFSSETTFSTNNYIALSRGGHCLVYDSSTAKFVTLYRDGNSRFNSDVLATTSTNNSTWIGAATENISNGSSGKITILGGINENQTGLTVNTPYYVQADGTLGTSGSYKIGRAVGTTKLLITEGNA